MSAAPAAAPAPGDQARVSIGVPLPPDETFRLFTEEIDLWWRRGRRFRNAGERRGIIAMEPGVGGRLFESIDGEHGEHGEHVVELGRLQVWEPPHRLAFEWRAVNFAPHEVTHVEVAFTPTASGTLVTVLHRGFSALRADHPVRHGLEVPAFIRMMGMWWGDQMSALRKQAASKQGARPEGIDVDCEPPC